MKDTIEKSMEQMEKDRREALDRAETAEQLTRIAQERAVNVIIIEFIC